MRNSVSNTGGVTYDQIFRAIGDRHRLQILTLLQEKELSAGEILKALDVVQSTLSHHMKSLVDAGVVRASRHGKWTYYSLNAEIMSDAVRFLSDFSEGTRLPARFSPEGTGPVSGAPAPAESAESRIPEPEKEKESSKLSETVRGEKKKAKKGKKGKKKK